MILDIFNKALEYDTVNKGLDWIFDSGLKCWISPKIWNSMEYGVTVKRGSPYMSDNYIFNGLGYMSLSVKDKQEYRDFGIRYQSNGEMFPQFLIKTQQYSTYMKYEIVAQCLVSSSFCIKKVFHANPLMLYGVAWGMATWDNCKTLDEPIQSSVSMGLNAMSVYIANRLITGSCMRLLPNNKGIANGFASISMLAIYGLGTYLGVRDKFNKNVSEPIGGRVNNLVKDLSKKSLSDTLDDIGSSLPPSIAYV